MATPQQWKITTVVPTTGIGPDGRPAKGQDVTYRLDDGSSSTLFIPDASFTTTGVQQAVSAHASNLVAVKALTGTASGTV